jgi:hypothetical protein
LPFSYWFDKPRFLTEGKLVAVLIIPSLGVPNWSVIYINTAQQSSPYELDKIHPKMLQRDGVVMVMMKVLVMMVMKMMIPMKPSSMAMTMATISPL